MTQITNKSRGPRGVNLADGRIAFLAPGQTEELELSEGELKTLSPEWFAIGGLSKADRSAMKDGLDGQDADNKTAALRTAVEKG